MPKRSVSVGLALALLMSPLAGLGQQKSSTRKLSNDQKIIHLLDRATFGSRPGDIERVKALGWEKFIEQQLRPETISDTLAEAKLQGLESITLTNDQIAAMYPQQGVVREALKARGIELPEGQNQPAAGEQDPQMQAQMQAQMQMRRQEAQKVLREMGLRPPAAARPGIAAGQDSAGRVQRASASGSDDRFLVQSLQRICQQGCRSRPHHFV